ncbi:MAG: preprotein translocase subunit SecG [Prevotellaceae bacterium]|jgi:preprotein translocase subunit SecG|nr:preprotein translocase subunit SecG [Prevotellaceae bacterium]
MYYLITALILVASILLILVVLVQNSKGGGLAANFAGNTQTMGVRRTADFLEKSTWFLACTVLALCLVATFAMHTGGADVEKSAIKNQVENTADPAALPFSDDDE